MREESRLRRKKNGSGQRSVQQTNHQQKPSAWRGILTGPVTDTKKCKKEKASNNRKQNGNSQAKGGFGAYICVCVLVCGVWGVRQKRKKEPSTDIFSKY